MENCNKSYSITQQHHFASIQPEETGIGILRYRWLLQRSVSTMTKPWSSLCVLFKIMPWTTLFFFLFWHLHKQTFAVKLKERCYSAMPDSPCPFGTPPDCPSPPISIGLPLPKDLDVKPTWMEGVVFKLRILGEMTFFFPLKWYVHMLTEETKHNKALYNIEI